MARFPAMAKSDIEEDIGSFFDSSRLPATVKVVLHKTAKGESVLQKGSSLYLLYIFLQPAVLFKDDKGRYFNESTAFEKCTFQLLAEDESFDDKRYLRVGDVMRLNRRPRYVRAHQGYAYTGSRGEDASIDAGQVFEVTNRTIDEGDKKRAVWYCVSGLGNKREFKRTPVYLPFRTEGQFTACLDDSDYTLKDLVDKVAEGRLSFPFRVQVAGSAIARKRKFTILSPCDEQWLVASDGSTLLRLQASLPITVKRAPHSDVELTSSLRLLSLKVNHGDIQEIRSAPRDSLSGLFQEDADKPKLPPRQQSAEQRVERDDHARPGSDTPANDLYAYIEVNKCRLPDWSASSGAVPSAAPYNGDGLDYEEMPRDLAEQLTRRKGTESFSDLARNAVKSARRMPVPSGPPATPPRPSPMSEAGSPHYQNFPSASMLSEDEFPPLPPPPFADEQAQSSQEPRLPVPPGRGLSPLEGGDFLSASPSGNVEAESARVQELLAENKRLRARCFQLEKEKKALQQEVENARSTPKRNKLSTFSALDVGRLLNEHKLGQYANSFEMEGVNGQLLTCLDDEMLAVNLGVANRFHRLKILQLKDS